MSIHKLRYGTPETFVPSAFSPAPQTEISEEIPPEAAAIACTIGCRGVTLSVPIAANTDIYGFGLQLKSFRQNEKKKHIRPNADPKSDSGDSHAPVPFFVTTAGFGIYVDTARYATFTFGRKKKPTKKPEAVNTHTDFSTMGSDTPGGDLYIEIPCARGVDLYYITGETVLDIVCQYNQLSGGGCMPPLWGLGNFYRCDIQFDDKQVLAMADSFRESDVPCDILGLEPGWQTHAYSCSYLWDEKRFPTPETTVQQLREKGFHVNLWEHAFTHPTAPIYEDLLPYSGDTLVWDGLVPDFATEEGAKIFSSQQKQLIDLGIDGFKLDECDGSDFTGGWSFPNCANFPSGMDGEQYHSLFGLLYAKTMQKALGDRRTLSEVRNMGSLAASYPFVLYSDLYGQNEFLTGVVNAGFSGLLWSPEVRHASCGEELLRRLQAVIFSAQSLINAFYLPTQPWEQHGCTAEARELLRLRMSLIPYLYTAFYDYRTEGKPPIRALVCDYEKEEAARSCQDQWLFGDSILVAPIPYPEKERDVYLPQGVWYNFFTGEKKEGGVHHVVTDGIPVYVKNGTILPLAEPLPHITSDTRFKITLTTFGNCERSVCRLIEDDGETNHTDYRVLTLTKDAPYTDSFRYEIVAVCPGDTESSS